LVVGGRYLDGVGYAGVVCIMAVLGKTAIGSTVQSVSPSQELAIGPYAAPENGTITQIAFYSATTGGDLKLGVYEDNNGTPGNLVASNLITADEPGWKAGAASGSIEAGKAYWIGAITSNSQSARRDSVTNVNLLTRSGSYSAGLTNPYPSGFSMFSSRDVSAYFTYTPTTTSSVGQLQQAINNAQPGDTLRVRYGLYNESLVINKPLKIVGIPDRRGRLPVIQGGTLVNDWVLSNAPEHEGKNVWKKALANDNPISFLTVDGRGVFVLGNPVEIPSEQESQQVVNDLLELDWDDEEYTFPTAESRVINFWQWYGSVAARKVESGVSVIYLRLKNNLNPNQIPTYLSNDLAHFSCTMQLYGASDTEIKNLDLRGGMYGVYALFCNDIKITNCRISTPAQFGVLFEYSARPIIERTEVTANFDQTNSHPGWWLDSPRAYAGQFAYTMGKHYAIVKANQILSAQGDCIEVGIGCTDAVIQRNWIHQARVGVGDRGVKTMILNNKFNNHHSIGVRIYPTASSVIRNNRFEECNSTWRIHQLNTATAERTLLIENNFVQNVEAAGYIIQLHYSGSGPWPSGTACVFSENFVQNGAQLLANSLSLPVPKIQFEDNVLDLSSMFINSVANIGVEQFTGNWVGGNAENAKNLSWFDANNQYILNQRLVGTTLPAGFEQVGTYRQNVGLPIKRRVAGASRGFAGARSVQGDFGGD
jgi:nitrous oxidase accessory protein NosD